MLFHHITGTADGGCAVVTMFHHIVTGSGNDKTGSGTDIECVFAVSPCTDDVDWLVIRQVDRYAHFEQGFAETG